MRGMAILAIGMMATNALAAEDKGATHGARTRNVAIVLYDGVEILDFAGPSEVFASAGNFGALSGLPAFRPYTVAASKDPILSQGFVKVTPEFSIDDAPKPDIIVLPGGNSSRLTDNPRFMAWVKQAMDDAEVTLTVCTGAFVAAKVGALDGKTVTTFYNAIESLRQQAPKADVQDGRRFVDSGRIVTTAGVSAGIDGALHVVARLTGRWTAARTAQYMEYHWSPEPYLAKAYTQLNPSFDDSGRAMQAVLIDEDEKRFEAAISGWRAILAKDDDNAFAWFRLGFALQTLKRYDEAVAAAEHATTAPELRGRALYNIACARALQGQRDAALAALEKAVQAGFKSQGILRGDPDLESIRAEARFQALLAKL